MLSAALFLASLILAVHPTPSPTPAPVPCQLHRGAHVVLYSSSYDPDVLVWDSRFRLRDYHAASFDEVQQLLPHARLVAPGTRATVESCVADFVVQRLSGEPDDAVGVILDSGPLRDGRGWVLGSDVRPRHTP